MKPAMHWRWLAVLLGLLLGLWCGRTFAAEMNLEAQVDRTQVQAGESIRFTLSLTVPMGRNGGQVVPPPAVDAIPGFDIVSRSSAQNMTWVNQEGVAQVQTRYELVPQQVGKAVIPGFSMKGPDGKVLTTRPIEISVSAPPPSDEDDRTAGAGAGSESDGPSEGVGFFKGILLFGIVVALVVGIPIGLSILLNRETKRPAERTERKDARPAPRAEHRGPGQATSGDLSELPGDPFPEEVQVIRPPAPPPSEIKVIQPASMATDFEAEMSALKSQFPEVNAEFYRHLFELFRRSVLGRAHRFGQALTPDELLRAIGRALPTTEEARVKRLSEDWEAVAWAGMTPSRGFGEILTDIRALLLSLRRLEN